MGTDGNARVHVVDSCTGFVWRKLVKEVDESCNSNSSRNVNHFQHLQIATTTAVKKCHIHTFILLR